MDAVAVMLVILVAVAVGSLVVWLLWALLCRRWVKSLEAKGWQFETSPGPEVTYGLNCPPFGLGFSRVTDDLITGTTPQGAPFRSFEYGYGCLGKERVVAVALPVPVPEGYLCSPDRVRSGTAAPQRTAVGDVLVLAHDHDWASRLFHSAGPQLEALRACAPVDVSTDGRWMVLRGVAHEADPLAAQVAALGALAATVVASDVTAFATTEPPVEMSFYGRPAWRYRARDDRYLNVPGVTRGGDDHEARDVMLTVDGGGVEIVAFQHHWTTKRTETTTDAQGHTSTRTVTDHHDEPICVARLPFPFGEISLNWFELFGSRQRFESIAFDERFRVRAADGRFASDVFHPRMMEWLMTRNPIAFRVESGYLRFDVGRHDVNDVFWCADFAQAFLRRVPEFVWHNLGVEVPSFRELD